MKEPTEPFVYSGLGEKRTKELEKRLLAAELESAKHALAFAGALSIDRCPACGAARGPNGYLCGSPDGGCSDTGSLARKWLASVGYLVLALALAAPAHAQTVCCAGGKQLWPCDSGDVTCSGPMGMGTCAKNAGTITTGTCAGGTPPPTTPTPTPTPASGVQYCHAPAGCFALPSPLACPAGSTVNSTPCTVVTPTPTPTPTATPTPTEPPATSITLVRLPYQPWPLAYQYQVPWIQQQPDGSTVISCNSGHYPNESTVPPPLGIATTWPGECKVVVRFPADGSTPQARQVYCTSQTTDAWETGGFIVPTQLNPAELHTYGVFTGRPVGPIGGDSDRDVQIEMLTFSTIPGVPTILSPNPHRVTLLSSKGVNYSPMGIVDLAGHEMFYVAMLAKFGANPYLLMRFRITQSGQLEADPSFAPVKMATVADGIQGPLNLVLASDGKTLLVPDGPWPVTKACNLWKSTDEGQTWSSAGISIPAPVGSVGIAQCGIAVGPGGSALSPMWGVCQTFWSQDGDDGQDWTKIGDWRPYVWYQKGANLPSNLLKAAVEYPPAAWVPVKP